MQTEVPILEYHDLDDNVNRPRDLHSPYILLTRQLYDQMAWLSTNGYISLTIDDLLRQHIPEKAIVLTFDDGHISNYKIAYPILKKFNFVATFFIVSHNIGKKHHITKQHILEMHKQKMQFGSHSLTHPYLPSLSSEDLVQELRGSKEAIEDIIGSEVHHFCVPHGFYNRSLVRCVSNVGYKSLITEDFGYYTPGKDSFPVLPRFAIKNGIELDRFANIVQRRKLELLTDYLTALCLHSLKKFLGYRVYVNLKLFLLRRPHLKRD